MVSDADRAAPVFGSTPKVTAPLPEPAAPAVTWIHDAFALAVHEHPLFAVTPMLPVMPTAAGDTDVADSTNEQGAASCRTVTVWPAIVSVPERSVGTGLGSASNLTEPMPAPGAPARMWSHEAFALAVQEQSGPAVTPTVSVAPGEPTTVEVNESVDVHGPGVGAGAGVGVGAGLGVGVGAGVGVGVGVGVGAGVGAGLGSVRNAA